MLAGAALCAQFRAAALLGLDARGATDGLRLVNVFGLGSLILTVRASAASAGGAAATSTASLGFTRTTAGVRLLTHFLGSIVAFGVIAGEIFLRSVCN